MGRAKSELLKRDEYAIRYAGFMAVKALYSYLLQSSGSITLSLEAEDNIAWDDIVCVDNDSQKQTRYQVKRQQTALKSEYFSRYLTDLNSSEADCILVLPVHVAVEKIGSTHVLRGLCDRLRQDGVDVVMVLSNLRSEERSWFDYVKDQLKEEDDAVCSILCRLQLSIVGYENDLENDSLTLLEKLYGDVSSHAWEKLLKILRESDGVVKITTQHLAQKLPTPFLWKHKELYRTFLVEIEDALWLNRWEVLCDNLVRDLLPETVFDSLNEIICSIDDTAWPNALPKLEKAFHEFSTHAHEYLRHFCEQADLWGEHYREDKSYRRIKPWDEAYSSALNRSSIWQKGNKYRLMNMIFATNKLLDCYRDCVDSFYRIRNGRLRFCDMMGVTNEMEGYRMVIDAYVDLKTGNRI